MSGLIACRAADTSTVNVSPVSAAAGFGAAAAVNAPAASDTATPTIVDDRSLRCRRVPITDSHQLTQAIDVSRLILAGFPMPVKRPTRHPPPGCVREAP